MLNSRIPMLIGIVGVALQCGTSAKSQQLKDGSGRVIGRYDVLNDSEAKANFDVNQNGTFERVASYKDQKLTNVEYFDDATGAKTKSVMFQDGKPAAVRVYDKNGREVRGDVAYDTQRETAREVTLPAKNKRVVFNGDGTVSVSELEKK